MSKPRFNLRRSRCLFDQPRVDQNLGKIAQDTFPRGLFLDVAIGFEIFDSLVEKLLNTKFLKLLIGIVFLHIRFCVKSIRVLGNFLVQLIHIGSPRSLATS